MEIVCFLELDREGVFFRNRWLGCLGGGEGKGVRKDEGQLSENVNIEMMLLNM